MTDGPSRNRYSLDHRKHRDAHGAVIVLEQQGKGPEVGWRPQHHKGKQPPGSPAKGAGGSGSSHQGRNSPGHPADHDVLTGARLEQGCVEQHITAEPQQGKAGSQRINAHNQHCHRQDGEANG